MTAIDLRVVRVGFSGFWGVLGAEIRSWLGRRGATHALIWTAIINGTVYFTVVGPDAPFGRFGYESLINLLMLVAVFAGIVLTEAVILGEYSSGIAAWLVSKPVARSSYVSAKLLGLWIGLAATAVLVPGLVAYWWLPRVEPFRFVVSPQPPFGRFMTVLLVAIVVMGFFIGLTGLLAVLLRRRGIASLLAIIAWLILRIPLPQIPNSWHDYLPSGLISPLGNAANWLPSLEYLHMHAFEPSSAVAATLVLGITLIGLAAVAFQRLEL